MKQSPAVDRLRRTRSAIAFSGSCRIAQGDLETVSVAANDLSAAGAVSPILIFDSETSEPIDVDLRGTPLDVVARLSDVDEVAEEPADPSAPRRPGRPRLGVVAREVTLLPRHWEWLGRQPGGASVALRQLVEEARRSNAGRDEVRRSQEAAYRFMTAMAGDWSGFEESVRALFARKREVFRVLTESWPEDVRDHARSLAEPSFPAAGRP